MASAASRKRVVVTGLGIISGLGRDIDTFWKNIVAGQSGIQRVTRFDPESYPSQVGCEATGFDPTDYMDAKEVKRNDRYCHFAMGASLEALKHAELDPSTLNPERFGVIVGSGIGGMETIEDQTAALFDGGPRHVSAFMIPSLISNMASGLIAIHTGARGPNYATVSACATGAHAIGDSFRMIQNGEADLMLTGGSEASITRLSYAGFCKMKAMSTNFNDTPERASRPFDKDRDGFVMGEGAGVLILESLEHALDRGAKIFCELVGYAATCDAYHITMPDPEGKGLAKSLETAMRDGNIQPSEVDYINAHGTSTPYNDKFETAAVERVFGEEASRLKMSSTKSMTGHLLGAAGGLEAAICCKALQEGIIPPTINVDHQDPECGLDVVANKSVNQDIQVALSNNLGFGGHNATLAFKKFSE